MILHQYFGQTLKNLQGLAPETFFDRFACEQIETAIGCLMKADAAMLGQLRLDGQLVYREEHEQAVAKAKGDVCNDSPLEQARLALEYAMDKNMGTGAARHIEDALKSVGVALSKSELTGEIDAAE